MDHEELLQALQDAGVDGTAYAILGRAPAGRLQEGGAVLDRSADGQWYVGGWERGEVHSIRRFDSESEACQYLYGSLVNRPVPIEISPEEMAAGIERAQREAAETLRQMRKSH